MMYKLLKEWKRRALLALAAAGIVLLPANAQEIFWSETGGFVESQGSIWTAAFDGTGRTAIATGLTRPIGIALDAANGHVYWAEDGFETQPSRIVRANLDGSEQTVLFSEEIEGFTNAQMIALDVANGHVYWTDFFLGVLRGNLDGTGYIWLFGIASQYTALDLDLAHGHIYYGDPTQLGVLYRMDIAGGNDVEILRGIAADDFHFNAIDVDAPNGHIYFTDTGNHTIRRMNLDGTEAVDLVTDPGLLPYGIAIGPENSLYWVGAGGRVGSSALDGTEANTNLAEASGTAFGIAALITPPPPVQIFWSETGGFVESQGNIWTVMSDGTGRAPIATGLTRPIGLAVDSENEHLYWAEDGFETQPSQIVRANLDGSEPTVLFSEEVEGFTNAQMIALDLKNGHVYWTDYFLGVIRGKLDGTGYTVLGGSGVQYTALDLDLVNNQIYYGDPTQFGIMFRMDMNGANDTNIVANITADHWWFNSIALNVPAGHVYYANTGTHEIRRMNLDGTESVALLSDPGLLPYGIALDPSREAVYWVGAGGRLGKANLDGSNANLTVTDVSSTAFGIAIHAPSTGGDGEITITGIDVVDATVTVNWTGGSDGDQLQRTLDVTSGVWENVGEPTAAGQATDTVGDAPAFYRVQGL